MTVRRGHLIALMTVVSIFAVADVAMAGQEAAASIIGQVKDESGAILPGVTVTAISPALQVQQIARVTNELGEYRLTPLPIGTYEVVYELTGFQSVRQTNVRLTVGFVARLDVVLTVGALAETVTVSGASPVVDLAATATGTELTREQLELTPTARASWVSVLAQAPGVRTNIDVGGSQAIENPSFRAFGQSAESWQTLEGVLTTSPKNAQSGNFIAFGALEEARVITVGGDAEVPTRGLQIVALVKSGGNAFHGNASWDHTDGRFQSNNIDAGLAALGVTGASKVQLRRRVNADLGGRIVRNKLWFYEGVGYYRGLEQVLGIFKPDGSLAAVGPNDIIFNTKLTYQLTTSNRLTYFHQWDHMIKRIATSAVTAVNPWDSRHEQTWNGHTVKGGWENVRGNALMTSVQYGFRSWNTTFLGLGGLPTTDLFTQQNTGSAWNQGGGNDIEWAHHVKGSATWYRPDLFVGNHEFKMGFDYLAATINRNRLAGDDAVQPGSRPGYANYRLVFNNGVPFGIDTVNSPVHPFTLDRYLGTYIRDQWVIARRLTLNLGLRYSRDNGFVPDQCREAGDFAAAECFAKVQFKVLNSVAPRLSAAYDVTGDGKTAIKAGWGRFDHKRDIDPEITSANKNLGVATNWRWRDLNGNRLYDPGEVNLNPNGSDFIGLSAIGTSSGTADAVPNPNEKQPKQDQFTVALERQLISDLAVRITGVYARGFNNYRLQNNLRPYGAYSIPITRPDPGPDGRVGTADDTGRSFTYYEYPTTLVGRQFQQGMLISDPNYVKKYKSIELAASKRFSSGWQFMTSYSATKTEETIAGSGVPSFDPNAEINTANYTWERTVKASGAYFFPYSVMLSANFEQLSGTPYARTVLFTGGTTIPSLAVNVEPLGTRTLPSIRLLDLRVEKRFSLKQGQRMAVQLNLYNVPNANTITAVNPRSGPLFGSFGRPTAVLTGRLLSFGASFDF